MTTTTFTTSPFRRSHNCEPKGTGNFAFCRATRSTAFNHELLGEPEFFMGTFTEAKKLAKASFAPGSLLAVLG